MREMITILKVEIFNFLLKKHVTYDTIIRRVLYCDMFLCDSTVKEEI